MFSSVKTAFERIKTALVKTSTHFSNQLKAFFTRPLDEEQLESIERFLYEADLGSECVEAVISDLKRYHFQHPKATAEDYMACVKNSCRSFLADVRRSNHDLKAKPHIIVMTGVNGSGKTTTCAKLAKLYANQGNTVLLGAADTFRAAAVEQLSLWAEALDLCIVKGKRLSDPASVVFDTVAKAQAQQFDVAIIDTAGRLESKADLMKELEKIYRTAKKVIPEAPHTTYMVVDATLGQTALEQIAIFHRYAPIDGIIITKLDGSAKGGIVLAIAKKFQLPVSFVGTGEKAEDLSPFDSEAYLDGLFPS